MNIERWKAKIKQYDKEALDSVSTPEDIVPCYDLEYEILEDWEKDRILLLEVIEKQVEEIGNLQSKIETEDRRKKEE
jgi:hypothetical protein